jgi:hypothetical protein
MNRAIAQSLMEGRAALHIAAPLVWRRKYGAAYFELPVGNSLGQSLKLVGQVVASKPHTVRYLIHDGSGKASNAVRLCVRGIHVNKKTDRREWRPGSHFHSWRPECGDQHADDPHDAHWPPPEWSEDSLEPLGNDELEDLFGRFCRMLDIRLPATGLWVERPPRPDAFVQLPDGEEIP